MSFIRKIFDAAKDTTQPFIAAAHRADDAVSRELDFIRQSAYKTPELSRNQKLNLESASSTIYPEQRARVEDGNFKWLKDDIIEKKARLSRAMPIESQGGAARFKIGVSELERKQAYANVDQADTKKAMSYGYASSTGKAPFKPSVPFGGHAAPSQISMPTPYKPPMPPPPPISMPTPYKPPMPPPPPISMPAPYKPTVAANKKIVPPPVDDSWGAMSVAGGAAMGALGGISMVGTDTKDGGYGGGMLFGAMTGAAMATGLKYRPGNHSKGYSSFLNHQHRRVSRAAALMAGGGLTSTVLAGERDHSSGFNKNRGNPIGR